MKDLSCGVVVPGCAARFRADSDDELMRQVATHAREEHGMTQIPPEVIEKVRASVREVP